MSNLENCVYLSLTAVVVWMIYISIDIIKEIKNPIQDERDQS